MTVNPGWVGRVSDTPAELVDSLDRLLSGAFGPIPHGFDHSRWYVVRYWYGLDIRERDA